MAIRELINSITPIYKKPIDVADAKLEEGTVIIFEDKGSSISGLNYWVEISGDRNVAGFFRWDDALDYAQYLNRKNR